MPDQDNKQQPQNEPEEKPNSGRKFIVIGVVFLLVLAAGFWYWRSTFTEDTDDAQVDGDIYQISSRIAGQVTQVFAEENKQVKKGDLLVEIDSRDQQVALEQAQANLANAQASYTQANVNVPITSVSTTTTTSNTSTDVRGAQAAVDQARKQTAAAASRVEEAKANAIKATKDVERYKPLVEKDVISKQQYDAAVAAADSANASVIEAENSLVAQQAAITQAQQKLESSRNQAAEAQKNGPQQVAGKFETKFPNLGGTLATKDLVFSGEPGGEVYALDGKSLQKLWGFNTGGGVSAPPMTFEVDGKQYVAILVGAGGAWDKWFIDSTPELKTMQAGSTLYVFGL